MHLINKIFTRYLYTLIFTLLIPVLLARLLFKSFKDANYRKRIKERFGIFPQPNINADGIWIHAVSVGETIGITPVIKEIMHSYPTVPIILTTTTPTGSLQVKKTFANQVFHVYCPFDIPWAINNFLTKVKPRLLLIMETEVWPNMINLCRKNNIPVILANARLSEKSKVQYLKVKNLSKEVFNQISCIAAQSEESAARYQTLGVKKELITVTGSVKFDMNLPETLIEQGRNIKLNFGTRSVFLAASTHHGEEEQILEAYKIILQIYPNTLLVLVPRHLDRNNEVEKLIIANKLSCVRKSSNQSVTNDINVFLGDTMGEMYLYLAMADFAFVGGSLMPIGGHNILEPAALGLPVITGEYMHNFAEISKKMQQINAMHTITNSSQLADIVCTWINNPALAKAIGQNGKNFVAQNKGSIAKLMTKIEYFYGVKSYS